MALSFVIPMWNEEAICERTLDAVEEAAQDLVAAKEVGDYEIVVVDDASTDSTPAVLARRLVADTHHRLQVVRHDVNRKLGASIRTGLAAARGDLVLYTDADLPFDLGEVAKALRLLRVYDADMVSAYRFDRTGEGPVRFMYSHLYNWLVRAALGVRVRDVNFAGKLFRRDLLDHVELHSEGSFIDVELLAKAERMGFHIVQFGVDYFPRWETGSTLSSPAVIRTILGELARLAPEIRRTTVLPGRHRIR